MSMRATAKGHAIAPVGRKPGAAVLGNAMRVVFAALDLPLEHKAERLPDGKVIIHDVPIFVETTERQGKPQPFTKAWLLNAASKYSSQPGYWAPMHFRHNDGQSDRDRAGDFRVTATRLRIVEGKPQWVSFASLRFDSEAACAKALAEFPYRSIEVSRDRPDEINSLALLSSEAPFHRLPNLVAFSTDERGTTHHSWRSPLMAKLTDNVADVLLASLEAATDDKAEGTKAEAEPAKDDDKHAAAGGDDDAPVTRKEFKAFMARMEAAVGKIGDVKAEAAPGGDEEGDEKKKDKAAPARSPVAAASASRTGAKFGAPTSDALAALKVEAQKDALEDRLKAIEAERESEKLEAKFRSEMAPWGDHNVTKVLVKLRTAGPEAAKFYADAIKENVQRVPSRGGPSRAPFAAEADEPKEVAAYAANPDRLRKARDVAMFFQSMPKDSRGELTLAGMLRAELGEAQ